MWYFRYIRPENIISVKYNTQRVGTATASGINASVYDCTIAHAVNQVTYSQLENSTGAFQSSAVLDIAHTLCEFNVTSLTKQWLKSSLNEGGKSYSYGFIIKAAPGTNGYMCLRAADDPAGSYPCFEITYNEDTSVNNGTYYIRNRQSGQYLDVYGSSQASGANVLQYPFHGGANQQWQIIHQNNGLYMIRPQHAPNMYLQVKGGANVDNSNVIQGSYNPNYPYQYWWRIIKNANGTYRLIPYVSTILALDNNGSSANSANILIGDYYGYAYQQWELYLVTYETELYDSRLYNTPENINDVNNILEGNAQWNAASEFEKLTWFTQDQDESLAAYAGATALSSAYDVASDMLLHFLNNTGEPYDIYPVKRLLTDEGTESTQYEFFISELNDIMSAAEIMVVPGQEKSFARKVEKQFLDSEQKLTGKNWMYSLGQHRVFTKTVVHRENNVFTATITYGIRDYYDWDPDYKGETLFNVAPPILWRLNYHGMARNYTVEGVATIILTWTYGERAENCASLVIQ